MTRKRKQGKRYHGLKNQGATCYLNSVLQVLYMTKDFREAVSQWSQHNHGCIDHHLSSLFNTLTNETASTKEITNHLGIKKVNEQHDAAECFDKILSCSSLKASKIFQGELTHINTCSKCERETKSNSPFWSLPLTLRETEYYSVADGIQKYFQESKICGESQLYCCQCNEKTDSSINLEMHHHPDVLTLLLKRFEFDYHHMNYVKIKYSVQIPVKLSIPTVEDKSHIYQLYAYVEHSGELRSGHYTVTIKPHDDDKWYTFNDSVVTRTGYQPFQLDEKEISSGAYLLFYRKTTDANEPCRKDVETAERQEGKKPATTTKCSGVRGKTQNTEEMKTGMVVGDDRSKMTETHGDHSIPTANKCSEYKKAPQINTDNSINCTNSRSVDIDEQSRDKPQDGSEKPNDIKQNLKPVQGKRKMGNIQVDDDRKKHKGDVDNKDYHHLDCKQNVSDTLVSVHAQKDHEQAQGIENLSETGGKNQILYLDNANENELNQEVLQDPGLCRVQMHDPVGTDALTLEPNMLDNHSSAKKDKTPSVQRYKNEEIIKHQQSETNADEKIKIKNNDRLKQNISKSSNEWPEGKEETPKYDQCYQTREKSESLIGEIELNQKTVHQGKDCQNKLQADIQQKINPVTEKMPVKQNSNTQNDTEVDDGKILSDCISMLGRNLLEQERQSDEEISGNGNIENVKGSNGSLTESNPEKMTQVSPDAEIQHEVGNGSGKTKKQNKKGTNKKQNVLLNMGLSCPRPGVYK